MGDLVDVPRLCDNNCNHEGANCEANLCVHCGPVLDLVHVPWECVKNGNHEGFKTLGEFNLDDLPEGFKNEETLSGIRSLAARVVRLHVKTATRSEYGSGTVFMFHDEFFILTCEHVAESADDVENCAIYFFYDTEDGAGIMESKGTVFKKSSSERDRCVFMFDPVPKKIREFFLSSDNIKVFPQYERSLDGFTPFVISHPHGGPKKITSGKYHAEKVGVVDQLLYTAKTCPGSSGGVVINVGGNTPPYLHYGANPCVHCSSDRADTNISEYDTSSKFVDWLLFYGTNDSK